MYEESQVDGRAHIVESELRIVPPIDIRSAWLRCSNNFPRTLRVGAGFSFKYDGQFVGPVIAPHWQRTCLHEAESGLESVRLSDASGLVVTRQLRAYPSADAVEYTLHFKNTSVSTLPRVSILEALNLSFESSAREDICVVSSGGGMADGFLPPRNFALRKDFFAPNVPDNGVVQLTTEGGRSSDKDLPFFFVHNETRQEGMFIAFGWSGQWEVFTSKNARTGTLNIRGKIPGLDIALEPSEEFRGPTVLVGFYTGSLSAGSNRLRRLIRDEYTPRLSDRLMLPVATYDHWWNIEEDFDEPMLMKLIDAAAALEQEYFLLDAGWFVHPPKEQGGWVAGTGNWNEVNTSKLPNGLAPIADRVRSKGLKFGLWFEPERVARGTQLANEHPDWVLWDHGDEPEFPALGWMRHLPPEHTFFRTQYGLLDYGRTEVQEWVCNLFDRYIREFDVKYIRYDFNLAPLPFWNAHDTPGRSGMTQLRHVHGFHFVIDWIRRRHPDTVLEGCASGGRRIDLETARRFHTFLISDHNADPSIIRYHLFGINHFLPGNYHYVLYTLPLLSQQNFEVDDLGFQSLFAGAFGTGGRIDLWPQDMQQRARLHVHTWKRLRRYLVEDFYSLSSQPGDLDSWSGWQFHDPRDQSGFIQTFRTRTAEGMHRFALHQLEPQAAYQFTDIHSAESFERTGLAAMTDGIAVMQSPMSSRVFEYHKIVA